MLVYLFLINATGFVLMLTDKLKAIKKLRRTPENTLLTVALMGGSLGVLSGMKIFRHKTKNLTFSIGIPIMLVIQVIGGLLIIM